MKSKKAIKRLTRVEKLLAEVQSHYSALEKPLGKLLSSAKASVEGIKDSIAKSIKAKPAKASKSKKNKSGKKKDVSAKAHSKATPVVAHTRAVAAFAMVCFFRLGSLDAVAADCERLAITSQPQSVTVFEGCPAIFTVGVTGSGPYSYLQIPAPWEGGMPPPRPGARLLRYVGRQATVTAEFDAGGGLVRCWPVVHVISGLEGVRLRWNLNWW